MPFFAGKISKFVPGHPKNWGENSGVAMHCQS